VSNISGSLGGLGIGDFILSRFEVEGVGVIISTPDDCDQRKGIKFVKVKYANGEMNFHTTQSIIFCRQRYLDATNQSGSSGI